MPKRYLPCLDAPQGPWQNVDCWQTRNENGLVMFLVVISLIRLGWLRRSWHLQCSGSAPVLVLLLPALCPVRGKKTHVTSGVTWKLNTNTRGHLARLHRTRSFLTACLLWGSAIGYSNKQHWTVDWSKSNSLVCFFDISSVRSLCIEGLCCSCMSIKDLIVMPSVYQLLWKGTMVQTLAWHTTCHNNMNLCCNFGSLMKCFQHAWFHHFLWKTVYVLWNDAAVMDSLIWNKLTRQGEKIRLREDSRSGNCLLSVNSCCHVTKSHSNSIFKLHLSVN